MTWLEAFLDAARGVSEDAERVLPRLRERRADVVVNVHAYAWPAYEAFHRRFHADEPPRVVSLSMNPGRNGAVQTGLSFTDAPQARELLPDFDKLVARPAHLRAERVEMSGRKLRAWAEARLGGLAGLHHGIVFPFAFPIAVLRGPGQLNVPLPALRGDARRAADAFYEHHAPALVRALEPPGILLLGSYAAERWRRVVEANADLARVPAVATHHPAARIANAKKFADWSRALARVAPTGTARSRGS